MVSVDVDVDADADGDRDGNVDVDATAINRVESPKEPIPRSIILGWYNTLHSGYTEFKLKFVTYK